MLSTQDQPRQKRNRRKSAILLALVCSVVCFQGCGDPVDQLVQAVRKPRDRYAFFAAIGRVNRKGRGNEAAVLLIHLLKDNNSSVGGWAAEALARIQADANLVVPALIEARNNEAIRVNVTESFGELGTVDNRVTAALILSLKDKAPWVQAAAMRALYKIGPAAAAAGPDLIEFLEDEQAAYIAAQVLGRMGPKAKLATPALVKLLKRAKGYDRLAAAEALWLIDQNAEVTVPALAESLKDPFLPIRVDAADLLGKIGPRASAAVPALIAARDYKPEPRPKAQGPVRTDEAVPAPVEMPEEEFYPRVRDAAVEALSKISGREEKKT